MPSRKQLLKETIFLLKKYGIKPKKKLSQNFIVSPRLLRAILKEIEKEKPERILEIGSGLGTLTRYLAQMAEEIVAIEIDKKLVQVSLENLRNLKNVRIIEGDFFKHYMKLGGFDIIVSNVPYHASSKLLFTLRKMSFRKAVLTLQREFAQRLTAEVGTSDYSRLTVMSNVFFKIKKIMDIGPGAFYPSPKVSSTLIVLKRRNYKLPVDSEFFENIVRILFTSRNKVLANVLKRAHERGLIKLNEEVFKKLGGLVEKRIRELTIGEIVEIAKLLYGNI